MTWFFLTFVMYHATLSLAHVPLCSEVIAWTASKRIELSGCREYLWVAACALNGTVFLYGIVGFPQYVFWYPWWNNRGGPMGNMYLSAFIVYQVLSFLLAASVFHLRRHRSKREPVTRRSIRQSLHSAMEPEEDGCKELRVVAGGAEETAVASFAESEISMASNVASDLTTNHWKEME